MPRQEEAQIAIMLGALLAHGLQKLRLLDDEHFGKFKEQATDSMYQLGVYERLDELDMVREMEADRARGFVISLKNRLAMKIRNSASPVAGDWFEFSFHVMLVSTAPEVVDQMRSELEGQAQKVGFSDEAFETLIIQLKNDSEDILDTLLGSPSPDNSLVEAQSVADDEELPQIFVSYARPDLPVAKSIAVMLRDAGFRPWLDKESFLGGQDGHLEIKKAIRGSHLFLVCLSSKAVDRKGFFHAETKLALEEVEKLPEGMVYMMPIRLDECSIRHDQITIISDSTSTRVHLPPPTLSKALEKRPPTTALAAEVTSPPNVPYLEAFLLV
jgi:hypothetical protein